MAEEEQLNLVLEAKAQGQDAIRDMKDSVTDLRNAFLELDAVAALTDLRNFFDWFGSQLAKVQAANIPVISGLADLIGGIGGIPVVGIPAAAALVTLTAAIVGMAASLVVALAGATTILTATVAGLAGMALEATLVLGPLGLLAAAMIFLTDTAFTDQTKAIKEQITQLGLQRDAAIAAGTWTKQAQEDYVKQVAALKASVLDLHDPLGQLEQDFKTMIDTLGVQAAPITAQIVDWLDSLIPLVGQAGTALITWLGPKVPEMLRIAGDALNGMRAAAEQLWPVFNRLVNDVLNHVPDFEKFAQGAGVVAVNAIKALSDGLIKFTDWFNAEWPKLAPIAQQIMGVVGDALHRIQQTAAFLVDWFVANWPEISHTMEDLRPVLVVVESLVIAVALAFYGLMKVTEGIVAALGAIGSAFDALGRHVSGALGAVNDFFNSIAGAVSAASGLSSALGSLVPGGGRAAGGPVFPGGVYTVGESGPETLIMGSGGGFVLPDGGPGRGGATNIFHIQAVEPEATAQAVLTRLLTST